MIWKLFVLEFRIYSFKISIFSVISFSYYFRYREKLFFSYYRFIIDYYRYIDNYIYKERFILDYYIRIERLILDYYTDIYRLLLDRYIEKKFDYDRYNDRLIYEYFRRVEKIEFSFSYY